MRKNDELQVKKTIWKDNIWPDVTFFMITLGLAAVFLLNYGIIS